MKYSQYKYIDVALGGPDKRNNVLDITTFKYPTGKVDCYRTIFRFDESYKTHCETTGTVSGYQGKCYADWLPFDIDDKDVTNAWRKLNEVLQVFQLDYDIRPDHLFFSGAKGFHVLLPSVLFGEFSPSEKLPEIFRAIAQEMLGDTVDSIYDINRLFRLNNSINSKTGLYKIPLQMADLSKGMDHVLSLAKSSRTIPMVPLSDYVPNSQLVELYKKHSQLEGTSRSEKNSDFWQMVKNGVGEGKRNITATRIAGFLKAKSIDERTAFELVSGWNRGNTPPLDEDELIGILKSVYRYQNKAEEAEKNVFPVWSVYDEYEDFVKSDKRVHIGIPEIDEKIRGIRPGQVMTIMGFTGNFKSAILQGILRHHLKNSGEPVLMFEMEMSRLDLFERAVQMECGVNGHLTEEIFKDENKADRDALLERIKSGQRDFYVVDLPALSFEEMVEYVKVAEEKIVRRKIGLVGIDFLQLLMGNGQTLTQRMDYIAKGMKDFAKDVYVPVIAVSQVTNIEDRESKIELMSARDSKTIPQMSDYVIGIWQNENDEQVIALLKNRKGGLGKAIRKINSKTLLFDPII